MKKERRFASVQAVKGSKTCVRPQPVRLLEYRALCRRAAAAQAVLAEYCTAIEDFGLDAPEACTAQSAPIHCRAGLLTPGEILQRAEQAACDAERLGAAACGARSRLLVQLLQSSRDIGEYRALCRLYVAPGDRLLPEAASPVQQTEIS